MAENRNIDARLLAGEALAGPAQERMAEKEMKRRTRSEKKADAEEGGKEQQEEEGKPDSRLRKLKKLKNAKQEVKNKIKEKTTDPIQEGSKWLLRTAWLSLVPSLGLSLIYINMHAFLRWVFPSMFCRLGEEWIPKQMGTGEHASQSVAGTGFGIAEILGLLFLDLLALFVIGSIFALLVIIVDFMTANIVENITRVIGGITELGWEGIKALIKLFN